MKGSFFNTGYEIIDFHAHPFTDGDHQISNYRSFYPAKEADMIPTMRRLGISKICGSVIRFENREHFAESFDNVRALNDAALALSERLGDFYVPGFHIHPDYPEESILEIQRMASHGVRLIGELVPYLQGWDRYDRPELHPIFSEAAKHGMVVSFHDMAYDTIDAMVSAHPDMIFVAAHPGEYPNVIRHVERMKKYDNVYLDLSGLGLFRWEMLRYLVDEVGSERILFGTDYPVCNPGDAIGGVLAESVSDSDLENIFSKNAKRILGI